MKTDHLTNSEKDQIAQAINTHSTGGHPEADRETLEFFRPDFVKDMLAEADADAALIAKITS